MMKFISKTIRSLLLIGMGVQIILGLIWIGGNITSGCLAEETVIYEKAAETMVMDEYVGALYPLLIRFSQIMMGIMGLPYESFLYMLQLGVAFVCACTFVRLCEVGKQHEFCGQIGNRWKACFGGLYLLTISVCVQWHLTVLPRSFTFSLYLLLLGLCIRGLRQRTACTGRWWYQICGLWGLMTLLMPDYFWFGLLPVIVAAFSYIRTNGRSGILKMLVALAVAAVLSCGINQALQVPGSGGRIQKTVGAALVSRFVWPHFENNYYFWPEEVKQIMDEMEARTVSTDADNVQKLFGPMIEEVYGRTKANEFYWDMALQCVSVRTKEVLQATAEDFFAYLGTPWSVKQHLDGSGLSYSGWNYGNMKENMPRLTKWYMDYGLVSFRIGFLLVAVLGILQMWAERVEMRKGSCKESSKENNKENCLNIGISACILIMICSLFQVIWYTMSGAGMMDYGNVPILILMWYMPVVYGAMSEIK